jgi:hypothetical protein
MSIYHLDYQIPEVVKMQWAVHTNKNKRSYWIFRVLTVLLCGWWRVRMAATCFVGRRMRNKLRLPIKRAGRRSAPSNEVRIATNPAVALVVVAVARVVVVNISCTRKAKHHRRDCDFELGTATCEHTHKPPTHPDKALFKQRCNDNLYDCVFEASCDHVWSSEPSGTVPSIKAKETCDAWAWEVVMPLGNGETQTPTQM